MKEALIYTRGSTDTQELNGLSLKAQAQLLSELSPRNNALIVVVFKEVKTAQGLREEGISERRELASRGIYTGCVPFGYRSHRAEETIEVDPLESQIVSQIFELCISGSCCMKSIAKTIRSEFGVWVSEANVRMILYDCFYVGVFSVDKHWYYGSHPVFLRTGAFYQAHAALNRRKQGKS